MRWVGCALEVLGPGYTATSPIFTISRPMRLRFTQCPSQRRGRVICRVPYQGVQQVLRVDQLTRARAAYVRGITFDQCQTTWPAHRANALAKKSRATASSPI